MCVLLRKDIDVPSRIRLIYLIRTYWRNNEQPSGSLLHNRQSAPDVMAAQPAPGGSILFSCDRMRYRAIAFIVLPDHSTGSVIAAKLATTMRDGKHQPKERQVEIEKVRPTCFASEAFPRLPEPESDKTKGGGPSRGGKFRVTLSGTWTCMRGF